MKKTTSFASGYDLFLLMGQISHFTQLVRKRELNRHHISPQQFNVLLIVQELGSDSTMSEVAKYAGLKVNAICPQSIHMERDGLIERIKDTPKSRRLRMELTGKGRDMLKISKESKSINVLYSVLAEEELQQTYSSLIKLFSKLKEGIDS